MGLLLASASTVIYQGMQQRSLSSSMMEARLRMRSDPPPSPLPGASTDGHPTDTIPVENFTAPIIETTPAATTNLTAPSSASPLSSDITLSDDPNWMDMTDFYVYLDAFSDSWYMSTAMFLQSKSKIDAIDGVEEACFLMFDGREDKVRMSLDWLDCGVEHMSKWWKTVEAPQNEHANRVVVDFLKSYTSTRLQNAEEYVQEEGRGPLQPTVALIAFQAYAEPGAHKDANLKDRCRELTVASLAATIASLVHVGMGRIIVVGHDKEQSSEQPQILEAFDSVVAKGSATWVGGDVDSSPINERALRGSQLVYVTVSTDMVHTDFAGVNLPRGALLGLHRAFTGGDAAWTKAWLGEAALSNPESLWKFVYLTEPDTLLHTRPRTVVTMAKMMQDGLILAPHRLQPIPYQSDFPNATTPRSALLPEDQLLLSPYPTITTLNAATDACCDDQMGEHRPGSHDAIGSHCGDFWWRCGYVPKSGNRKLGLSEAGNHSRILDHYRLMRLQQGTGVTTLAGTEHGRRCIPVTNGMCHRKAKNVLQDARRPRYPWTTPSKQKKRRSAKLANNGST